MKRTLSDYSSLRAAEYNDSQINAAWLDTRQQSFREKLSLSALGSRYLLGAKGTGKTHLLRYFSLKVALKRNSYDLKSSLNELGAISIYLRLPNDLSKFDHLGRDQGKIIFKVYFELLILRSTFDLIDNICSESNINDSAVCEVAEKYFNKKFENVSYILEYINNQTNKIDEALKYSILYDDNSNIKNITIINNIIFRTKEFFNSLREEFFDYNVVYLFDEFENVNSDYKKIINELVRMSEPGYFFRIAGRKESAVTSQTLNEKNKDGNEFILIDLDVIYNQNSKQAKELRLFILDFIEKHLRLIASDNSKIDVEKIFGSDEDFSKYLNNDYSISNEKNMKLYNYIKNSFMRALPISKNISAEIFSILANGVDSLLFLKLNIIRFMKSKKINENNLLSLAAKVNFEYKSYLELGSKEKPYYTALNHYKSDIMSQLHYMENPQRVPLYYGFETLCQLTSYNPRNVLNVLYKIENQLKFDNKDFFSEEYICFEAQSRGFREAAKHFFNEDTSYGSISMQAKQAIEKIGSYLQAARFSLKIPESSPLAISFAEADLDENCNKIFKACIEFSLLQNIGKRNDRNLTNKQNIKVRLNPMLSPLWYLPAVYRGDLSLSNKLVNLMFSQSNMDEFNKELKQVKVKWNTILNKKNIIVEPIKEDSPKQWELF
ncbi:hypothetical protein ABLU22_15015 [Acinetobacter lwoffii]|uniref:ORC-CDC6 family AAA ATPase n=1 Tax=Acinetobacter lwoffii TaxID=28090 RepID=UPI0001BBA359|nr:hypothetical protein [Acinetobacter lwoffii]EEY89114.1 hypothetical protein HMPREF0017_02384 [Acinetobacter lwoffii SH145]ENW25545.1 hypothetical protein F925_00889 [Acinetobacter lwoffii NCTC 5866 = CIP 64.10 = NIPH 512]QZM12318.1 hypothetical protein ABVS_1648 [Acinetobacter lwoffii]